MYARHEHIDGVSLGRFVSVSLSLSLSLSCPPRASRCRRTTVQNSMAFPGVTASRGRKKTHRMTDGPIKTDMPCGRRPPTSGTRRTSPGNWIESWRVLPDRNSAISLFLAASYPISSKSIRLIRSDRSQTARISPTNNTQTVPRRSYVERWSWIPDHAVSPIDQKRQPFKVFSCMHGTLSYSYFIRTDRRRSFAPSQFSFFLTIKCAALFRDGGWVTIVKCLLLVSFVHAVNSFIPTEPTDSQTNRPTRRFDTVSGRTGMKPEQNLIQYEVIQ
jgi:hypothetical protein